MTCHLFEANYEYVDFQQLYPVTSSFGTPVFFSLERAAAPYFGIKVWFILAHDDTLPIFITIDFELLFKYGVFGNKLDMSFEIRRWWSERDANLDRQLRNNTINKKDHLNGLFCWSDSI